MGIDALNDEAYMNEHEEEDQLIADKFEINKYIAEEILTIKKKKVKKMNQKTFDKLVDKICVKYEIGITDELNEFVEDKLIEALEKIKVKLDKLI